MGAVGPWALAGHCGLGAMGIHCERWRGAVGMGPWAWGREPGSGTAIGIGVSKNFARGLSSLRYPPVNKNSGYISESGKSNTP